MKAENVYDLNTWKIHYIEGAKDEPDTQNRHPYIALERPLQLGCSIRASDLIQTQQLYNKFSSYCFTNETSVL